MTSSDVRDVLNLPDGHSGPRPSKKQKTSVQRSNLKGLAREVQNLGGDNPIAIVPEVTNFKKRRFANRKPAARWEMRPFQNSARQDASLILRHWRRKGEKGEGQGQGEATMEGNEQLGEDKIEDSLFSKYNVQVSVPQYSEDQYRQSLRNEDWTKEETDYLLDLAQTFDLRWPLIWDRYEWNPPATNGVADADGDESKAIVPAVEPRSMEDLKARYYEVASKMMAAQKPVQYMTQPEFALHELMAHFNPTQEKLRKDFALHALTRSREEAREEESLLLEIKRIMARSERFNEERRELYNRLDYPRADTDISTFKSSAGLQTLLQNMMSADKSKKRKSLMAGDGVSPSGPIAVQGAAQDSSRRESTAASTGHRDSTGPTPTPTATNAPATNSKKGPPQQQERRKLTTQEEVIYGVTHHDRLGSGPTFRTEKINKLFTHKSNQQQIRITNALNELDVPSKLVMPTAATTHQYELLLGAVNSLLDARKVSDKIDAEIKVEQSKKAEREKLLKASEPEADAAESKDMSSPPQSKDSGAEGTEESADVSAAETNGDVSAVPKPTGEGDDENATGGGSSTDKPEGSLDPKDGEKNVRPSSSGASHKRSASELNEDGDKSAKRQKK